MKIILSLAELAALVETAKQTYNENGDYTDSVEIEITVPAKYHAQSDKIAASFLSKWSECNSRLFYRN